MGADNCKSPCGLNTNATQLEIPDRPNYQDMKYGTSGVDTAAEAASRGAAHAPASVEISSRTKQGNKDKENAGERLVPLPEKPPTDMRSGDPPAIVGTVGSGDAAGGVDAAIVAGHGNSGNGNAGGPLTGNGGGAGSYSSTYFGREGEELARLPLPAEGANHKYRKRYSFQTGATFDGQWCGNKRDGFGVQRWPDGAEFQGQWSQNYATGKGRFKHSDGSVYIGEWRQNIAHGNGIYRHKDGTTYAGCFAEDLQDGQGVESWPDKSQFVGQFSKGKKNGFGEYTWPDGSKYTGQWKFNQIDGIGAYMGADKRRFDGSWKESMMHGLGKYQWPDGRAYEGQYNCDQKDGFGVFTWSDGRYYEGYWHEGRQHGLGRLCQETGVMRLAQWDNGERVAWRDEDNEVTNP